MTCLNNCHDGKWHKHQMSEQMSFFPQEGQVCKIVDLFQSQSYVCLIVYLLYL